MSWRTKVTQSRTCIAWTIAVLSVCFASCRASAADPTRPNILLVVVDDLGWAGVGYHAKSMVTPNLNKLAGEGTELSRFYVYPVCSPTRVALLTGQMPRRFDVLSALQGAEPGMPNGLLTIPSVFKTAGYQTSLIGKWHVGKATTPQQNGFDHFYGFLNAEVDYYKHTGRNGRIDWQRDGKTVTEEGYTTYLLADEAVRQIKSRDKATPFYFQVCLNAPHDPLSAPGDLVEKHKGKGEKPGLYAAVVEAMDIGIGRVIDALDAENVRDNTIVVFFSDNGAAPRDGASNAPLRFGKGSVYEGGIHTPALIRWPGKVAAGGVLTQPVCVQDLFPTLAAAAGVPMLRDAKIDGRSQWPAIAQGRRTEREPFLIASFDTALIDGDWKLIAFQDGKRSLFDLKADLAEQADQFSKQPDIAARLGAKLDTLKKDLPPVKAARDGPFRLGPGTGPPPTTSLAAQPPVGKAERKLDTPKTARTFQTLWIPPIRAGKSFDLTLSKSSKSFWPGATTATYGFNEAEFWGPTLVLNQGDTVQMKVKNDLGEPTTVHWHGLHLPPNVDGGPHQVIPPGKTWAASFTVRNNAATYWYHPHPHEATQKQITSGAGGLIIIKDPVEAKLPLPRTYGVDDIPVVLTSRRFSRTDQFTFEGDGDKYGDYLFANGTLDAQVSLPAQFVRLRILNAEIERGYDLGFSDGRTFYVIATDGGLVDQPVPVTRMKLMVGERVEVLVNLGADKFGSTLDLMAFNSRQPFGFPGGEPGRSAPNGSYLNNLDFRLLHINVAAPTATPITKLPETLTRNQFPTEAAVSQRRTVHINRVGQGDKEFAFDKKYFDMHAINQVVKLGAVEAWTVTNDRTFGHTFHIHDVQFKIVKRSDGPVADYEQGWKDSVYVPRSASVTFIAKFDDFASDTVPFMYHCHMANHEDGGLMGQFLVSKYPTAIKPDATGMIRLRNRIEHPLTPESIRPAERPVGSLAPTFRTTDLDGKPMNLASLTEKKPLVLFFIDCECPCSRDAAPFMDRLQSLYGDVCTVVGITNSDAKVAGAWAKQVGVRFSLVADPNLSIINDYSAVRSVSTTVVAPGGKIVKTYPAYNAEMLTDLSATVARLGGVAVRTLPVDDAPKKLVSGCPFQQR